MADISKIKLPNNSVVNIKDARITGVDTEPTSGSTNVVTSGGIHSAIQSAISSVYKYKGTKANYASLPSSGNVTGDVWNVEAAYGDYPAGTNWAWTGSGWDALGGEVDLSSYLTKTDASSTYATKTQLTNGSVTKLGTTTVGSSVRPIYLNAGTPTAITEVATDYIGWTSADHDGLTSIENLFYTSGTNAFAYLDTEKVDVEYSNDGGTTWVDYGLTAAEKVSVFTYSGAFRIGKKTTNYTTNDSVRVTIHVGCGLYCKAEFLVIKHNFAGTTELKIERTTYAAQDTYEVLNTISCSGNPSFRVIPLKMFLFGNNGIHDLRITATYVGPNYPTLNHSIAEIRLYASKVYSYPSNYARYRHLYSIDAVQNAIFPAGITSSTLSVTGNTTLGGTLTVGTSSSNKATTLYGTLTTSRSITTSGHVAVGTGSNNGSYIGSDSATNIYLHNSAGYPLIADGLVVRRGAEAASTTLGSTQYPWGGVYSTSFVKKGGTASQFLKADGSVDSNTYALASAIPTVDATPTASSTNAVSSGGVYAELAGKQETLTFDTTPIASSTNPVTSGGLNTEFGKVSYVGDNLGAETYTDSGSVVTDLSGYATKAWVEAKGYLTTESDPGVYAWAKAATKPTYTASEVGALPSTTVIPTRLTQLTNDAGFIVGYTETDPTVPSWAKAASKPTYAASEITNDVGYVKYVLLQSESDMPANPDSGTLYLIPE